MPTPTYVPLANVTLTSNVGTITMSGISQNYRDLRIIVGTKTQNEPLLIKLNNSNSDMNLVYMYGTGSSTGSGSQTNPYLNIMTQGAGNILVDIMDYSATDKHKTLLTRTNNASSGVDASVIRWGQTTAITSFQLYPETAGNSLLAGMTVALYGIAA